jgi:ribosomal protein S12 methylthiotransferase
MTEFRSLLAQGVQEVILIAQDLGDFGKDRDEERALAPLLKEMLTLPGNYWIRLLYLYPDEIDDELIAVIKSDARICPYIDMPIQHVNNQMLQAMRRKTSKEDIISTITKLRKEIPSMVIRTSLMVGFPGETEEAFQELKAFIEAYPLDNIGVFKYSNEEGSLSSKMEAQVDEATKERRFHELMQAQERVLKKRQKKWIGKKLEVIVEGYHPETNYLMIGRFYGQCPEIDGQVIINDGRKVTGFSQRYLVEITDLMGYDLVGKVVAPGAAPTVVKKKPALALAR